MELKSLDECLELLIKFAERNGLGVEAELIGISNLRNQKEIGKFVDAYQGLLQQDLISVKDKKIKGSNIRKLLNAGYSIGEVTDFFMYDCFYFTLGHVVGESALRPWYSALDKRWPEEKRDSFSEMYKMIRASLFPCPYKEN